MLIIPILVRLILFWVPYFFDKCHCKLNLVNNQEVTNKQYLASSIGFQYLWINLVILYDSSRVYVKVILKLSKSGFSSELSFSLTHW